jgi:hypothetical protein
LTSPVNGSATTISDWVRANRRMPPPSIEPVAFLSWSGVSVTSSQVGRDGM